MNEECYKEPSFLKNFNTIKKYNIIDNYKYGLYIFSNYDDRGRLCGQISFNKEDVDKEDCIEYFENIIKENLSKLDNKFTEENKMN